jgi:hypothetical protein
MATGRPRWCLSVLGQTPSPRPSLIGLQEKAAALHALPLYERTPKQRCRNKITVYQKIIATEKAQASAMTPVKTFAERSSCCLPRISP